MFLLILLFLLSPVVSYSLTVSECHNVFLEKDSEKTHVQRRRKWMLYEEAKVLIQKLGFKNRREFREWSKSGKRPWNFPSSPSRTYVEEWQGWGEFLGTGNKFGRPRRKWMLYEEAKVYIQAQAFRNSIEFEIWSASSKRPYDFPSNPQKVYKDKWEGWKVFLGNAD